MGQAYGQGRRGREHLSSSAVLRGQQLCLCHWEAALGRVLDRLVQGPASLQAHCSGVMARPVSNRIRLNDDDSTPKTKPARKWDQFCGCERVCTLAHAHLLTVRSLPLEAAHTCTLNLEVPSAAASLPLCNGGCVRPWVCFCVHCLQQLLSEKRMESTQNHPHPLVPNQ